MEVRVRKGTEQDVKALLQAIKDLAAYEREPDAVKITEADLLRDGFGPSPLFGFLVANVGMDVVGIALYYPKYSTWRGPCLYLEDLIVDEAYRGKGIGKKLLDAVHEEAKAQNMDSVQWQVLDWNEPSIEFYNRYGAKLDSEWINCWLPVKQV